MICEVDLEGKKESICEKQLKKMISFIYWNICWNWKYKKQDYFSITYQSNIDTFSVSVYFSVFFSIGLWSIWSLFKVCYSFSRKWWFSVLQPLLRLFLWSTLFFVFSIIFVHIQLYLLKCVKLMFVVAIFAIDKQLIRKWPRRICLI